MQHEGDRRSNAGIFREIVSLCTADLLFICGLQYILSDLMIRHISCKRTRRAFARMLSKGRCIHQVIHLCQAFDIDTFSWLSHGRRSSMRQENHGNCSERGCIAYNSDMTNYETKHATDGCQCDMVSVPYSDLVEIIRDGKVPLFTVEHSEGQSSEDSLQLKVHPRDRYSSYIAVSHVWADGLGNPNCNALPACQLKQLWQFQYRVCFPQWQMHFDDVLLTKPCSSSFGWILFAYPLRKKTPISGLLQYKLWLLFMLGLRPSLF
jgi:hypothetical protein